MKKLLFIALVICSTYNVSAQCDNTLPIMENFDTNNIGVCWQIDDQDGDSLNWTWYTYSPYYGGHTVVTSYSVSTSFGALNPDNWIISIPIDLTSYNSSDNIQLSYKIKAGASWAAHEYYTVYAATGNQTNDFLSSPVKRGEFIDEVGGAVNFVTRTLNLSALTGNTVYIAFRHHNSTNQSSIDIDQVSITVGGNPEGCISDSDNDGVCDPEDQCPGLNDALIGTPCNDGDPCTINDIYDTNCGCSGTFADSDNDGVCDAFDDCPNTAANVTVNASGCDISGGCVESTTNFNGNSLSGSNTTILTLPSNSQDVSFTISGISEKLKGKSSMQYIEIVEVLFDDGLGSGYQIYGTYSGANTNNAAITILGPVLAVKVILKDQLGNSDSNLSINFSAVNICSSSTSCPDGDNDGVCDNDDLCPSTPANTTVDATGCEITGCQESTANFNGNALSGSSNTILTLPGNSQDVSFTISGIGEKTKGKPDSQYIEIVKVEYKVSSSSQYQTYDTFNGATVSSAIINIPGTVASVKVTLTDQLGNAGSNLDINFSTVTYCNSAQSRNSIDSDQYIDEIDNSLDTALKVYPNPASKSLYVKSIQSNAIRTNISLYNNKGVMVSSLTVSNKNGQTTEMDLNGLPTGLYLLRVIDQNGDLLKVERIIIK